MRKRCRVGYLRLVRIRWPRLAASLKQRQGGPQVGRWPRLAASLKLLHGYMISYPLATAGGLIEVEKVRLLHLAASNCIRWPRLAASLKYAGRSTSDGAGKRYVSAGHGWRPH